MAVPPATPAALRYYTSGNGLWVLDQVVGVALLAAILFSGLSARLRDWARRIGRNWFFTIVVYFALFTIVTSVIVLPLTYYEEFVRQHDYGLSTRPCRKWRDRLGHRTGRGLRRRRAVHVGALSAAAQEPAALVAVHRRRRHSVHRRRQSRRADLDRARSSTASNRCRDKALEARILALADRAGIEGSRVFEVNKSVDTKTLNAYVAGLWQTKRIVLWDTIIARMDEQRAAVRDGPRDGALRARARLAAACRRQHC